MQLRVLTLNAWALPEPLSRHAAARVRRIGEALSELGADVVALQEIWTQGARRQLTAAGHRAGYEHIWHQRVALGGSGLMLLSRLPMVRPELRRFMLCGLPQRIKHGDYYGGKGYATVELQTAAGTLCLLNTHLIARYGERSTPDEYLGHRAAQVVEIAAAASRRTEPTLAVGDFNIREGDPEYRALLGLSGLRDAAAALDSRQNTSRVGRRVSDAVEASAERIDFVFTRDGRGVAAAPLRIRRVLDEDFGEPARPRLYSDHCGLLAEIEIGGVPERPRWPEAEAFEIAEKLLARGVALARERRCQQRTLSGLGAGAALALLGARGGLVPPRRRLLRAAALAGAGAFIAGSGTAAWLAEVFSPTELSRFERVHALLAELQVDR